MNAIQNNIQRSALFTAILALALTLPAHYSQAQHSHRHNRTAKRGDRLPDSLNTSEEVIRPYSSNDDPAPAPATPPPASTTINTDSTTITYSTVSADSSTERTTVAGDSAADEPFTLRAVPDSTVHRLKNSRDFAYANDPDYWKKDETPEKEKPNAFELFLAGLARFFGSTGFRYFLYVLAAAVLLFALYKIVAENNLRFFYRSPIRSSEGTETDEMLLSEEDLDQRLTKALAEKDHRLATRYLYLRTLRHLDHKELIRLHAQTMDAGYIQQMSSDPEGQTFSRLASLYEKVWFGGIIPDETQFGKLQTYFSEFNTSIDQRPAS